MSNIFAPWVRYNSQRVPISIGVGPISGGYKNQHLWFTDKFSIESVRDGVIHHYGDALPFDVDGRLCVSSNQVDFRDQGIPFTALGHVAVQDTPPDYVDQGVGFTDDGHICSYVDTIVIPDEEWFKEFEQNPPNSTLPIEDFELNPVTTCISVQLVIQLKVPWANVPNFHRFFNYGNAGNDRFRPEKNTGEGSWAIPADLSGVFASQLSFTDVPAEGETLDFRWTLKPTGEPTGAGYRGWLDQADLDSNATPTEFDNPLTHVSWLGDDYFNLIALRINQTCDITDAEIIAWPNYNPKPPSWSAMPPQFNYDTDLPDTFDTFPYVSSVNGPVGNFSLVAPPAGFTIDSVTGVITAAAGAAIGVHVLTVNAENDTGAPGSNGTIEWEIEAGSVPVWSAITDQSTRENNLPTNLDVSGDVSSPTSAIIGYSLVAPPAGFSINASGVITVAAGTAIAAHVLTVQATNGSGSANSAPFTWNILEALLEPEWGTIPNQDNFRDELTLTLDASLYVTSNSGPLTNWTLSPVITGFTIDGSGLISATQAASEQLHTMSVTVNNDSGQATSDPFDWNVKEFRLPPQWETIPPRSDRENTLPQDYDVSGYVTSNDGALSGWAINPPVAGFTISPAGVVTAAASLTPDPYPLTVEVTNNQGTESQTFTWTITEELLPPQWGTIPDRSDRENTLPQHFEASAYVTSNDGQALFAWTLINAPAGFSIDTNGRVTCAAGTALADHTMQVRVSNATGTSTSNTFTWSVLEELLVPQWSPIPNQSDDEDTLPQALDVSPYVTSNSGPLTGWTLISTNAGFTINGSGGVTATAGLSPGNYTVTVRVSNDTGSADGQFTWEIVAVAPVEYFHEFNASLGVFFYQRLSEASAYDDTPFRVFLGVDEPAFPLNPWNGSAFTPAPDSSWRGLWLERPATNLLEDSTDHYRTPPWVYFETTTVDPGDPNTLRRTTNGLAMVYQALTAASAFYTTAFDVNEDPSFPGLAYFLSNDATISQAEVFNAETDVHRNKATLQLANPLPAVGFTRTGANERLKINNSQCELGPNWSSYIKTVSSTVTRAQTVCQQFVSTMGLSPADFQTQHSGQFKFEVLMDGGTGDSAVCMSNVLDGNNYLWAAFLNTGQLYIEFRTAGSTIGFLSATITAPVRGDIINLKWRCAAGETKVWFNAETQTAASPVVWPNLDGLVRLGGAADSANIVANTIRINSTDPGDGVVGGWS